MSYRPSKAFCPNNNPIVKELVDAGIIAPECRKWHLVAEVNSAVKVVSEVFVTEEQFRKIADALLANRKSLAEVTVHKSIERGPEDPGITEIKGAK